MKYSGAAYRTSSGERLDVVIELISGQYNCKACSNNGVDGRLGRYGTINFDADVTARPVFRLSFVDPATGSEITSAPALFKFAVLDIDAGEIEPKTMSETVFIPSSEFGQLFLSASTTLNVTEIDPSLLWRDGGLVLSTGALIQATSRELERPGDPLSLLDEQMQAVVAFDIVNRSSFDFALFLDGASVKNGGRNFLLAGQTSLSNAFCLASQPAAPLPAAPPPAAPPPSAPPPTATPELPIATPPTSGPRPAPPPVALPPAVAAGDASADESADAASTRSTRHATASMAFTWAERVRLFKKSSESTESDVAWGRGV